MKVAELQRFLSNFGPFAKAAGASEKVAAEFERAMKCLEPFKEKSLAEFNDFLLRADEFDRTGKLTPPARNGNGRTRAPKAPGLTVDEAVQIFNDLHKTATQSDVSYADIDAKLKPFEKLSVAQLKEIAARVGVVASGRARKVFIEALAWRIKELKASHERTQFRLGETA
jgi:hypothetical protein